MQKTSNSNEKVMLRSPNDFYTWDRVFRSKAVGVDLWDYIEPDLDLRIPWPTRPKVPKVEDYPKAATTPSSSTRSSATLEYEAIDAAPPRNMLEMTSVGRSTYIADSNNYNARIREYTDLIRTVNQLKDWVIDTVSTTYRDTLLDPNDTLDIWYEKLCNIGSHLQGTMKHQAKLEYQSFIDNTAKRPPKDLGTWATEWEGKLALAEQHGATDLKESYNLATDLQKAFGGGEYSEWVTAYRQSNRDLIRKGKWDFRLIASDLRDEANIRFSVRTKSSRGGLHKGSFHTFGDLEDTNDSIEVDTSSNRSKSTERGRGSSRGRPGRGRGNSNASRNKRPRADTVPDKDCKLCRQAHPLERCWYAFPELASEDWTPSKVVQAVVEQLLEANQELAREIDRIRKKRSKQEYPASKSD